MCKRSWMKHYFTCYECTFVSVLEKRLYIIAGCNGAGKTTASFTILLDSLHCKEFVNADEIARGISPFQPEHVALEAGRIMLSRINDLLAKNVSFAIETTLSSKSYQQLIATAQEQGYWVTLVFFWLQNVELAKERVKTRVLEGGHNIDEHVIERRYYRGVQNLFNTYLALVDSTFIFDNSFGKHQLIAQTNDLHQLEILDENTYEKLKAIYHGK